MTFSSLFGAKVFLWYVMFIGLLLAMAFKTDVCRMEHVFFCTVADKDDKHWFIACLIARAIWVIILQMWASLTCANFLLFFKWVSIDGARALHTSSYHVVFDYF